MGIKSGVNYVDSSTNPIVGCTGCALRKDHCYAATLCTRYAGRKGWPQSFDNPEFFPGRLEKAIKWKDLTGTKRPDKPWLDGYPRVIFVNDLSDGFCPDVDPSQWLLSQIDQMAASPHIWMLLTKWPDRMAAFFERHRIPDNFWSGTSVTTQKDADKRIPALLRIGAAMLYVSLEPLLGAVRFREIELMDGDHLSDSLWHAGSGHGIDWVIVGGETGHGARPMDPQWARSLRDQCQAAGTPYFHKHNGEWTVAEAATLADSELTDECKAFQHRRMHRFDDGVWMARVGKKRSGCLLDGRTWNEMPRRKEHER